jgi:hypothetical protein
MSTPKFLTGSIFTTQTVAKVIDETPLFSTLCQVLLARHIQGDWGDLEEEDKESNEEALLEKGRLFSSYNLTDELKSLISVDEKKVWIITEYDRSATTILFPTEY